MRALKITSWAVGGVLVFVGVLLVVFSLPSVQRALLTRAIPMEPGESLEMEYFRAGLNHTEARGIRFTKKLREPMFSDIFDILRGIVISDV